MLDSGAWSMSGSPMYTASPEKSVPEPSCQRPTLPGVWPGRCSDLERSVSQVDNVALVQHQRDRRRNGSGLLRVERRVRGGRHQQLGERETGLCHDVRDPRQLVEAMQEWLQRFDRVDIRFVRPPVVERVQPACVIGVPVRRDRHERLRGIFAERGDHGRDRPDPVPGIDQKIAIATRTT